MAEMKDVFEKAESKMKKAVGHLQEEYAAIRAGRANPAVLLSLIHISEPTRPY